MPTNKLTFLLGVFALAVSALLFYLSGLGDNAKAYGENIGLIIAVLAALGSLSGIFCNASVTMSNLAGCLLLIAGGVGLWKAENFRELIVWSLFFAVVGVFYVIVARRTKRVEDGLREAYRKSAKTAHIE